MTGMGVSGVLGVCQVGLRNLTQRQAAPLLGCGVGVSGVSGFRVRTRVCVRIFIAARWLLATERLFFLHASRTKHT